MTHGRPRVAHAILARPDSARPVLGFVWDAVEAVAEARDLEVEPLFLVPFRGVRALQSASRRRRARSTWPSDLDDRLRALRPRPTLIPYLPVPSRSIESAALALALALGAREPEARPRLLHGSFLDEGGYCAAVAAQVLGVPCLAVAHGSDVRAALGELEDTGRAARARFTLAHAARILAISDHLRACLASRGVDAPVVRWTTRAERFPLAAEPPPRRPGALLFAGNIGRGKGVDVLLRALAQIPREEAFLRLVGPEVGDLDVLAEARALGVEDRVELLEPVATPALAAIYAGATVTVLPSRHEGLGVVLVESLLVGRPVVGTSVGGIPEVVTEAVGALAAPEDPADLARVLRQVLAREAAGEFSPRALREAALPLTWEKTGPNLVAETKRLLAGE